MRSLAVIPVLAVLFLQMPAQPAFATPDFPALTGRVVDEADLLSSSQKSRIAKQLEQHEAATSNQVVVVTLPSLQGTTIEDFGYQLGRHWGIGQAEQDNGLLLIVAPNERKVRIEVGYGLEGDLPDATAKVIIEQYILPAFRNDDFPYGIAIGVDTILRTIDGGFRPARPGPQSGPQSTAPGSSRREGPHDLLIFFLLIFALMLVLYFKGTLGFGRDDTRYGSGGFGGGSGGGGGGGFSGGGGSFGGGGSSGSW